MDCTRLKGWHLERPIVPSFCDMVDKVLDQGRFLLEDPGSFLRGGGHGGGEEGEEGGKKGRKGVPVPPTSMQDYIVLSMRQPRPSAFRDGGPISTKTGDAQPEHNYLVSDEAYKLWTPT